MPVLPRMGPGAVFGDVEEETPIQDTRNTMSGGIVRNFGQKRQVKIPRNVGRDVSPYYFRKERFGSKPKDDWAGRLLSRCTPLPAMRTAGEPTALNPCVATPTLSRSGVLHVNGTT